MTVTEAEKALKKIKSQLERLFQGLKMPPLKQPLEGSTLEQKREHWEAERDLVDSKAVLEGRSHCSYIRTVARQLDERLYDFRQRRNACQDRLNGLAEEHRKQEAARLRGEAVKAQNEAQQLQAEAEAVATGEAERLENLEAQRQGEPAREAQRQDETKAQRERTERQRKANLASQHAARQKAEERWARQAAERDKDKQSVSEGQKK